MRVGAVDVDLAEDRELSIEFALGELFDIFRSARFLAVELVAGEGQNLEASISKLLVDFHHFSVVSLGCASICGHVDNHHALLPLAQLAKLLHLPVNIRG